MPRRHLRARQRREWVEAPGEPAGDEPDRGHRHDDGGGVRERREDLACEHLAALSRPSENRLQRPVVALRGDDVAGDERRDQREGPERHEEERDERHREARVADVPAERHVVRPARLELEDDDEDERHEHGRGQAEVRPLLGEELHDLPPVDRGHATSSRDALLSPESPPVSPRKSSSRLAVSGTRAVTPIRAWPSAMVSAAAASSSAWKRRSAPSARRFSTPRWAEQIISARSGSVARSRYSVWAVASRSRSVPS